MFKIRRDGALPTPALGLCRASERFRARLKGDRSFEIPKSWLYKMKGLGFTGPVKGRNSCCNSFVNTLK